MGNIMTFGMTMTMIIIIICHSPAVTTAFDISSRGLIGVTTLPTLCKTATTITTSCRYNRITTTGLQYHQYHHHQYRPIGGGGGGGGRCHHNHFPPPPPSTRSRRRKRNLSLLWITHQDMEEEEEGEDENLSGNGRDGTTPTATTPTAVTSTTTTATTTTNIINAALLIAGTTVGGGFLALPSVVSPIGFIPSTFALIGIWIYFWCQSMIVVECIIHTAFFQQQQHPKQQQQKQLQSMIEEEDNNKNNNNNKNKNNNNNRSINATKSYHYYPGIAATAKATFGRIGESIAVCLLVLLTEATLVSQLSRAGSLLFPPKLYAVGCTITAGIVAMIVFGNSNGIPISSSSSSSTTATPKKSSFFSSSSSSLSSNKNATTTTMTTKLSRDTASSTTTTTATTTITTKINSILTTIFVSMAIMLFVIGAPLVKDWSQLWTSTLPSQPQLQLLQQQQNWKIGGSFSLLSKAIPTLLQLLVYGEILPTICQLLQYQIRPIIWSITIGSILPLLLEVGWAALGLGLVPPSLTSTSTSSSTVATMVEDPVNILLAAKSGFPIRFPLWILAITAITTTIIGSYLALQSTWNDLYPTSSSSTLQQQQDSLSSSPLNGKESCAVATTTTTASTTTTTKHRWTQKIVSWFRRQYRFHRLRRRFRPSNQLLSACVIVLPGLAIASISPNLFLQAIDFAGSYPVLLLWGIAPPLTAWKQRYHQYHSHHRNKEEEPQQLRSTATTSSSSLPTQTTKPSYRILPNWALIVSLSISLCLFIMSATPDMILLWHTIFGSF